jgi:hypothetical protein
MYSHAAQILALECVFGGSETLHVHTRSFSLSERAYAYVMSYADVCCADVS